MNKNFYKEYICSFCEDILKNPQECVYCHQNYCELCIVTIKNCSDGKCLNCKKNIKTFVNKYLINSLINIKFFCPDCGESYHKYKEFDEHIKSPHNKKDNKNSYKCKFCFYEDYNEKNFIIHLIENHKLYLLSIVNLNSFQNKNLENNPSKNDSLNVIEQNMELSCSFNFGKSSNSNVNNNSGLKYDWLFKNKSTENDPLFPPEKISVDVTINSNNQSLTNGSVTKMQTD
jgi:hypothetical protein